MVILVQHMETKVIWRSVLSCFLCTFIEFRISCLFFNIVEIY